MRHNVRELIPTALLAFHSFIFCCIYLLPSIYNTKPRFSEIWVLGKTAILEDDWDKVGFETMQEESPASGVVAVHLEETDFGEDGTPPMGEAVPPLPGSRGQTLPA